MIGPEAQAREPETRRFPHYVQTDAGVYSPRQCVAPQLGQHRAAAFPRDSLLAALLALACTAILTLLAVLVEP